MSPRQEFEFRLTYFTTAGTVDRVVKWVTEVRFTVGSAEGTEIRLRPNIMDAVARLRGLRDNGGQAAMPGLEHVRFDGWPGAILVEHLESGQQRLLCNPVLVRM